MAPTVEETPDHEHVWVLGYDDCVLCGVRWSDLYMIVFVPE